LIGRQFHKCRDGLEFPSLETQLVFSAVALVFLVDRLKKNHIGWRRAATLLFPAILVPVSLGVSGDTSAGSLAAGAVIGILFTLVAMCVYGLYLEPAWRCAKQWCYVEKLGYKDTICKGLFNNLHA